MTRESNRRFHFLREIASGTFGSVYLAKEIHSDGFSRLVAIKLLHRRWSESEEVTRRIRDEARLLGWLRHRNIVDVVDLTAIDGRTAVIMEFLEAADFKHIADHLRERGETIPMRAAVQIAANVAGALDAAYNRPPYAGEKPLRVIHRDIKPSNVMVDDGGVVKVLDFGVARADFESRESSTADLQFGSVDYMPPERLFFEPETPASDVYSLGATFYEILAFERLGKAKGRPDRHAGFVRDRLSFLRAMRGLGGKLATGLEALLIAMLDYEHTERPSAARVVEVCRELSRLATDEGLQDWAEHALPPIVRELQREATSASHLDGRMVVEDSSAIRVRESEVASSFRAIPDPRFDTKGRPITPPRHEQERRMGSAAMEALGASPVPVPASAEPPAPSKLSVQTEPAKAQPTAPEPAAPEPEAPEPAAEPAKAKLRTSRTPTASFIPRTYSTGAFPRAGVKRGRGADPRRSAPVDPTVNLDLPDQTWDDEQEATALVDPELLESLKAGKRIEEPVVGSAPSPEPTATVDQPAEPVAEPPAPSPPPPAAAPPPPAPAPPPFEPAKPEPEPEPAKAVLTIDPEHHTQEVTLTASIEPTESHLDEPLGEDEPTPLPTSREPQLTPAPEPHAEDNVGEGFTPSRPQEAPDPEPEPDDFQDEEPTVMRPGDSVPGWAPQPSPAPPPAVSAPAPSPVVQARPAPPPPVRGGGSLLPSAFLLLCAFGGAITGFALFMGPGRVLLAQVSSPAPSSIALAPTPPPEPGLAAPEPLAQSDAGEGFTPSSPDEAPAPGSRADRGADAVRADRGADEPDALVEGNVGDGFTPSRPDEAPPPEPTTLTGAAEFTVGGDLRKLQVRCAEGSAIGTSPLEVPLGGVGACTVTAIYQDRSRATAVLDAAEPGQRYRCFEGGANLCTPQ